MPATPRVPDRLRWTAELLAVRPSEQLLEIGCGAGHAVALVCDRLTDGRITAIDRSAAMVARARARNADGVAAGRARIERQALAGAAHLGRFARTFAVNVNAFWTAPGPSLAALAALLQPGGTAHLVYEPPTAARLDALRDRLPATLAAHGFRAVAVHEAAFRAGRGLCVVAAADR